MSKQIIIGLVGFAGAGKDTVAQRLVSAHGFRRDSFAAPLKDLLCAVFGWDRNAIEGHTAQSRQWRETVDPWWAAQLNIPNFSPRWAMQHIGTDVMRNCFCDHLWIASLQRRLTLSEQPVVISDARFVNEIAAIRAQGAHLIRVQRGPDPSWMQAALTYNAGPKRIGWALSRQELEAAGVHASEYSWIGQPVDHVIHNTQGDLDGLDQQIDQLVQLIKSKS